MTSNNHSIAQSARADVVFTFAEDALASQGEANPGAIIRRLSLGPLLRSDDELAMAAREHAWLFMIDDYDRRILYEHVLYRLETVWGPLICVPDDDVCGAQAGMWGYAGIVSDSSPRTINLTPDQLDELWVKRLVALVTGHPDHSWYHNAKEIPRNVWRLRAEPVAADLSQPGS